MSHNQPPALPFDEADLDTSVPARFQRILQHLPPEQLAYDGPDERLTYQELAAACQQLAVALAASLGQADSCATQQAVALFVPPNSAAAVVGILGTLAAGHFYVPLDMVMGAAMLRQILQECPPQAIVTTALFQGRLSAFLAPGQNPPVLCLDALPASPPYSLAALPADGQMLASLHYTSGTTGKPRGVMWTHATNIYTSYLAHHDQDFMPGARIASLRSYAYAASLSPIFGGLLNGASLYTFPAPDLTPVALYQWIADKEITHLSVTLGLLRSLADLGDTHQPLNSLRIVITGGEPLHRSDVQRLYRILSPACKFVARLVSTETSIYARFVITADTVWAGDVVPGGYAGPCSQVMVLDQDRRPVATNQVGELAVRNRFLAAGYWQRPEETAARFLPDPEGGAARIFLTGDLGRMNEAGCLEFVGRKDGMVKIRGYRVELQPIEVALVAQPGVSDCAVVAQPRRDGELRLIAYVVLSKTTIPSARELRQALAQQLPSYMIPQRFVLIDQLVRKVNSKIDLTALPPPDSERPNLDVAFVAPRTELEQAIADIWAELLELEEVGVEDNFFELGGDSLLAMGMALQVEQQHGGSVPASYFNQPTVARLALLISKNTARSEDKAIEYQAQPLPPGKPTSFRRRLAQQVFHIGPLWHGHGLHYGLGVRLQRWLMSQPWARKRYASKLALVDQWANALGLDTDRETLRTISLLANTWMSWRSQRFEKAELGRWLTVIDPDGYLPGRAHRAGGLVLAMPHVARTGRLLLEIFRRAEIETAMVVGGEEVGPQRRARMLWQARQVLQRNGVVMVAADGLQGVRSVGVPFWGRQRPFQTGAAELAVETNTLLIPAFATLEIDGRLQVELTPPLTSQAGVREAQIADLTRQYGTRYAARWPKFWSSVNWRLLDYHLKLPPG